MAVTVLEHVSEDEMNWYHESRYWMHVSDMITAERHATETGMAKGLEAGLEKCMKEGLEKGIQQGLQQGIQQGTKQANLENAKKMLECNLDFDTIYKVTGISEDELLK